MKKFIMAAITAVMLAMGISVSANAEYPLSISYSDGYVTWEKASSETTGVYSPTLVATASENGQITKVKVYKSVYNGFFVNNDFYNGETVKFMLWNDINHMEPMAASADVVIANEMKFGVFSRNIEVLDSHGKKVLAPIIFTNGQETYFVCREGINAEDLGLSEGDVIMYAINSDQEIIEVKKLFRDGVDLTDTESLWTMVKADSAAMVDREYVQGLKEDNEKTDLYFGAICDRAQQWFEISDIKDNISDVEDDTMEIDLIGNNVNIYVINYNNKSGSRISVSSFAAIQKTNISSNGWIDYDRCKVDWSKNVRKNPNLALVRGVDREAIDIVVIKPILD